MKVTVIVENTKGNNDLKAAHGLSFLIEIEQNKILFDLGPSGLMARNAQKLGIDMAVIDGAVLSHGHVDHTGGLGAFRKINGRAPVYMHDLSLSKFRYKVNRAISIPVYNRGLQSRKGLYEPIKTINSPTAINPHCKLYCHFQGTGQNPSTNEGLERLSNRWEADDFTHEVALHVKYGKKNILFTGCSHNGVANIVESVKAQSGVTSFDYIFGGFHLFDPVKRRFETDNYFRELEQYIKDESKTRFYTGHCTGQEAFALLKDQFGDRVESLYTGMVVEIDS